MWSELCPACKGYPDQQHTYDEHCRERERMRRRMRRLLKRHAETLRRLAD